MLMTLPPGSAGLAASLFELMSGLKLPRHRRRTTRRVRADFMLVALEESPTTSSPLALCGLVSSTVDEPAEADDDIGRGDLAVADSLHGLRNGSSGHQLEVRADCRLEAQPKSLSRGRESDLRVDRARFRNVLRSGSEMS